MRTDILDSVDRRLLTMVLLVIYLAVNFGWRTIRQIQTTGSSGFRGISGKVGSAEWTGGVLFVVALALGITAPAAAYCGMSPIVTPHGWQTVAATALVLLGVVGTTVAQLEMGKSWRIGVDRGERTDLIQTGLFAYVRNPIFSFMLMTSIGLTWLLPNWLSAAASVLLVISIELQVRLVEEPYLKQTHGVTYKQYCQKVGRFIPGFGRD